MNLRPPAPQTGIISQTRRRPPNVQARSEIIKSSDQSTIVLKVCSICHKISASDEDHLDCRQKRRIELEDEDLKQGLPERFNTAKNIDDLNIEIKALLEHMTKEKEKKS